MIDFCGLCPLQGSAGQGVAHRLRKRLEITRALATQPELLLLDETAPD